MTNQYVLDKNANEAILQNPRSNSYYNIIDICEEKKKETPEKMQ